MSLYVKTGQYSGNGSGSQSFDIGFTPKAIWVWGTPSASAPTFEPRFKTDLMPANDSQWMGNGATIYTDGNITFSGNNLVVAGTSTNGFNATGKTYRWLALGGPGCVSGSYTGNGGDNRNITGLGIDPDFVFVSNNIRIKTTSTGKTTDTSFVARAIGPSADAIQELITDGFQVGTLSNVNTTVYYYVALENTPGVFQEGIYTGDGVTPRNITGVGFDPSFVFIKSSGNFQCRVKSTEIGTAASSWIRVSDTTTAILALITDGFQIGNSNDTNASASFTYPWFAFKDNPAPEVSVDFLLVAGGGSGGNSTSSLAHAGGGGGAGGYIAGTKQLAVGTYSVTIGAGGSNANGSNSTALSETAVGGGKGGNRLTAGNAGGSGGGAGGNNTSPGAGTSGQGNNGGSGVDSFGDGGGGGGGATEVGANKSVNTGGKGGDGYTTTIRGSSESFAGGGGGGNWFGNSSTANAGGSGGGGNGGRQSVNPTAGTANRGGGGGGAQSNGVNGANGGSGIFIVRYLTGTATATGGTITTSGGYTIHTFTSSGTFEITDIGPSATFTPITAWFM